jgi:hypothetical protein
MKNKQNLFTSIFLGAGALILAFALLVGIRSDDSVLAAPPAIPTPVSFTHSADKIDPIKRFWADNTVISASGASSNNFILAEAEGLDIHHVIDQGTSTNTITLTLQFSNDGTNWVNGLNVVVSNTTDINDLLQFNNFGWRTRLYATVANTNNVTLTHVSAVGRR